MSDTPPPAAPQTPPPAAGGAPMGAAPVTPGPKQTLSLASFIVGLASFVLSWFIGLGLIPGIVAVVLGFKAKKTEPGAPPWMSMVGIIAGFVGIGLSIIVGLVSIFTILLPLIFFSSYTGGLYY